MPTIRVTAVRKFAGDVLDMFEATYETMTPIVHEEGSRVYLVDAANGADANRQIGTMLDQAQIAGWADHISGFKTQAG